MKCIDCKWYVRSYYDKPVPSCGDMVCEIRQGPPEKDPDENMNKNGNCKYGQRKHWWKFWVGL